RVNPSTHLQFTPPAMIMYGEDRMLGDLQRTAPDYIGIINHQTTEYDAQFFGIDYGVKMLTWVKSNYERIAVVGPSIDEPESLSGITLFRRNAASK
ncbi:MAG: hypothetical protein H7144_12895, partial [Burkholderiales bacterium]|nr:hypothetical protein [Phycisphaerae bacterium]